MIYGTRQDEHGQLYQLEKVGTNSGRSWGILVRRSIFTRIPKETTIQLQHQWRIFANGADAEILTKCPGGCPLCAHIDAPTLQFFPNDIPQVAS